MCLRDHGSPLVLYPLSMLSSFPSLWAVAAGPLANLIVGGSLWFLLWRARRLSIHFRYFLWLTTAYNLFTFAGYIGQGAVTNYGDWAVLLRVANLNWFLRGGLVLLSALLFFVFMCAVAFIGSSFLGAARGRRLTFAPYCMAGAVACGATAMSRFGLPYIGLGAAASLGAGLGLVLICEWGRLHIKDSAMFPITRSFIWIIGALLVSFIYIVIIGRGLHL